MNDPAPFEFLPLGAIIQYFVVGKTNIVQNFPKQSQYVSHNTPYFGETIGRIANRVKDGKILNLNSTSYQLAINNAPNHLHGGNIGWGKKIWTGPKLEGVRSIEGLEGGLDSGGESVSFSYRSVNGEENYPGTVDAKVVYTVGTQRSESGKEVRVLGIEYTVQLVEDGSGVEETVVNVTNHS
jgi:aldose 1-epimerase